MKTGHDKEVVERGKLYPILSKRVLHQESLMALESPERCRTAEMDPYRDVWPAKLFADNSKTSRNIGFEEREKPHPVQVE